MFDVWAQEHSVLREKVVEHTFLAELSRALLLDLRLPFEVLRAEYDANGYDVAIEAAGILRHVQLKTTATTGSTADVAVQVALADKPGGCVVWIFVEKETLALGPFLWFGGEPGRPLPPLGDRVVRHSRADATGKKKVRQGLRRLPRGMFTRIETIEELARVMFQPTDHRQALESHLSRRSALPHLGELVDGLTWEGSAPVAYMIDGYALAKEAGIRDPFAFAESMRANAERDGRWHGSALELWIALFMEHRRDHFGGPVGAPFEVAPLPLRDELCRTLSLALASMKV
ncbi:hypothetical protein QQS45_03180 [Alteriqipengyuania flavescens]|uniref:hypothetical protein n=1 Tax=Alteriqipengyuania flavescens TaxID=3053610 RepID=UPI0025B567E2|nr:hypothetical protein [Alteriqipengyuania flavescens]WJY19251.1 hypothetical protein QQW98_03175 [Alteriqipengyuania flavescens]WJY25192.1 hypothetical protein QQS45_03180 [Alteriqipengyuania flavescens]